MNKNLSILCLIMVLLSLFGIVGTIINSLWGFAAIFITYTLVFIALFCISLQK